MTCRRERCKLPALVWLALVAGCRDPHPPRPPPPQVGPRSATAAAAGLDLAAWLRMRPSDLGCWMERSFGRRDPVWGCSTPGRPPATDPCQDDFEEGPAVPPEVARAVHPLVRAIDLAWEGGALQSVRFHFDPEVTAAEMPRILGIGSRTLESAADAGPGACATPCYEVVVFAASDVDCEPDDEDGGW